MALTAEQQNRLTQLQAKQPSIGLDPQQQTRLGELQAKQPAQPVAAAPVQPVIEQPEETGFFARREADTLERAQQFNEIIRATTAGEQSTAEGLLQIAGKVGAGSVVDFISNVAREGIDLVLDITPDSLKEGVTQAGVAFLETPVGMAGMEALTQGAEAYQEFAINNPRAARNIEAVANPALLAVPVKGKPTPAPPTAIGKTGVKIIRGTKASKIQKRKDFTQELISPKQTPTVRTEQIARTTQKGILKKQVVAPSKQQQSIIKDVTKLDVKSKNSLVANHNIIQTAVEKEATKLANALEKSGIIFPRKEYAKVLDDALDNLAANPLLVGDAQKTGSRIVNKMKEITVSHPSTPKGLLDARKELDRWILSQKGTKIFDPASESAMSIAIKEVRQTTNNFIGKKAPNEAVKRSLKKQSNLFTALDNIAPKAATEASNTITRLWRSTAKALPFRGADNQNLALLFGLGGLGSAAAFAPSLALGALGGVGIYKGTRALSPTAKRGIGELLKFTDKAIRTTTDKNLLNELRQGRATVVELLAMSVSSDEEILDDPLDITPEQAQAMTPGQRALAMGNIPDEALQLLRGRPAMAPRFDETFGAGAAESVLGAEGVQAGLNNTLDESIRAIPQMAIEILLKDPSKVREFDQTFGEGTGGRVLEVSSG